MLAAGMERDPVARLVARQIGRLEGLVFRLESYHSARGYFGKDGVLNSQ